MTPLVASGLRRHATSLMLNPCKRHVFAELNYPHIIGISGYERHHDMANLSALLRIEFVRNTSRYLSVHPRLPIGNVTSAPIVPIEAPDSGQTMAKQGQTSGQRHEGKNLESKGLEGLTVAAREAANRAPAGKGL